MKTIIENEQVKEIMSIVQNKSLEELSSSSMIKAYSDEMSKFTEEFLKKALQLYKDHPEYFNEKN